MAQAGVPSLPVLRYPDPLLKRRARPVTVEELQAGRAGGTNLRELAARMIATLYTDEGAGLAAPQVGVSLRLFVADASPGRNESFAVFNPQLSELGDYLEEEEGCLSFPEIRAKVKRAGRLVLTGLDAEGRPLRKEAAGLLARICQHETDHLDGLLFIQRMGPATRFMLRRKLRELEEEYQARRRLLGKR
jgi:peptide deformylase